MKTLFSLDQILILDPVIQRLAYNQTTLKHLPLFETNFVYYARSKSVGGFVYNQPVLCGGYFNYELRKYFQDCFVPGQPDKKMNMLEKRGFASSVVLEDLQKLWIVGGKSGFDTPLNSTELISLDQDPIQGI